MSLEFDKSYEAGTFPLSPTYRVVVSEEYDRGCRLVTLERRETYTNDRTGAKRTLWDPVVTLEAALSPEYTGRNVAGKFIRSSLEGTASDTL